MRDWQIRNHEGMTDIAAAIDDFCLWYRVPESVSVARSGVPFLDKRVSWTLRTAVRARLGAFDIAPCPPLGVKASSHVSRTSKLQIRRLILLIVLAAAIAGGLWAVPQTVLGDSGQTASVGKKPRDDDKSSYFTDLWQLDKETRASKPGITFHRSNCALAFSYNFRPNPAPLQEVNPAKTLTKPEVAFQISFKARLWRDIFGRNLVLWFAYTQRSFWQLYNFNDSSPFRETNYEPEILLNLTTRFSVLGLKARFIQIGINHQSNGQSEPLSRSWNRIVANVGIERGGLSLLLKGWYRIPDADDDNPGLTHYVGHGEMWAYYFLKRHRFGVMVRDNLNFRENRGAIQLEWSFPLFAIVGGYVQYFHGYGESLLDYDHRVHRIGIGFIISDWY
jgi:phospholipase A1